MHIARFLLATSLFLFTLLTTTALTPLTSFTSLTPLVGSAAALGDDCTINDSNCVVYEMCDDDDCWRIYCEDHDDHCNNDAQEHAGYWIDDWSYDHHHDHHEWARYEKSVIVVRLDIGDGYGEEESAHDLKKDIADDYDLTFVDWVYKEAGIVLLKTREDGWGTAEMLQADHRVVYAEPNVAGESPRATRGNAIWLWGSSTDETEQPIYTDELLQLDEAHTISTGDDVVVAVIDTGIDDKHLWFHDRLTEGYDFVDNDPWPHEEINIEIDDGEAVINSPMYGHGTHVSGIIAQVAPDAQIMPLRALDSTGVGNIVPVAEAILYAAEHCADVINLSMGTPYSSALLEDVINIVTTADAPIREACGGRPLTIVAAAGNDGNTDQYYPAAYPNVLAVTSNNENNEFVTEANYGEWVTLSAPGENIYSSVPYGIDEHNNLVRFPDFLSCMYGDSNACEFIMLISQAATHAPIPDELLNYCVPTNSMYDSWNNDDPFSNGLCDFWSGTSMAAPFVAGSAALVSSVSDSANISTLLATTATPLGGNMAAVASGVVSPLQALTAPEIIAPSQPPLQVAVSNVGVMPSATGIYVALLSAFVLMSMTYAVNNRCRPHIAR